MRKKTYYKLVLIKELIDINILDILYINKTLSIFKNFTRRLVNIFM